MSRWASIGRALLRRLVAFVATLAVSAALVVVLFARAPGDAIDTLPNGDDARATLAAEWGLGGSFADRVGTALSRLARGELGSSLTYRPGTPVAELVAQGGSASLGILVPAALLGLGCGFALAILGKPASPGLLRPAARALSAASALPVVLAGLLVLHGVNGATWTLLERGWIDRPSWFALPEEAGPVRTLLAITVLAFASARLAQLTRRADGELRALDAAPFVHAERARGGPVGRLYVRHLLVPAARLAADTLPALFSGLIVVERAFNLPGAGTSFYECCRLRDWPVAAALALAAAGAVAAARLAAETLAIGLDPREREAAA